MKNHRNSRYMFCAHFKSIFAMDDGNVIVYNMCIMEFSVLSFKKKVGTFFVLCHDNFYECLFFILSWQLHNFCMCIFIDI